MFRTFRPVAGVFAVAVIVVAVWFAAVRTTDKTEVRAGVDQSPPYGIVNQDGSVRGMAVDVLNEAARRRGIRLVWKPLDGLPPEDALSRGVVDLLPLAGATPGRKSPFFLSTPWIEDKYVLASLSDRPLRSPANAAGQVIAHADLKFTALLARQYFPRSRFAVGNLRSQALQALCRGAAAGVLIESHVLTALLLSRPAGCETASLQVSGLPGATRPLSIAAVPQARGAAKALRDEITVMSGDGSLAGILDRWSPFSSQGTRSMIARQEADARSRMFVLCLILILLFSSVLAWAALRARGLRKSAERAEAGRREMQRRFSAFMDHSPAAAFMKDAAGRLLYVNRAWSQMLGRKPEDCYGRTDFELWPRETALRLRATDQALLAGEGPRQSVESVPVSTTESRELLVVRFPFSNERGERFVGGTAIDITEREATIRELAASESRHRELFEQNPLPAWVYDRKTLAFLTVNDAAIRRYGWTREDFLSGMTLAEIIAPRARPGRGLTDETFALPGHCTHVTKDGLSLSVDVTCYELEYERRPARLMIVRDLTEQERTLEQLRISEERWQLALRGAGDALWDWDIATGRVFLSARWCSMLGYEAAEIGETREDLLRLLHPDDIETMNEALEGHLAGATATFTAEYRLRHKNGAWRWIMDRGQAVWDERGRPVRMAGSHTDITERRAAEELLTAQARTDALTGVANRREFDRLFGQQFRAARENAEPLSVCICDLDRFKEVNDYYGHAAGDRVLIAFAEILRRNVRRADTLARIGGDEFGLALDRASAKEAYLIMERIREQLRATTFESGDGVSFSVTSSFGVAALRSTHQNCDELMEEADRCLYEAKGNGRDRTLAA